MISLKPIENRYMSEEDKQTELLKDVNTTLKVIMYILAIILGVIIS